MWLQVSRRRTAIARLTRVRVGINTVSTSLDTDQSHAWVLDEIVERSDSVTSTSNTGDNRIGQFAGPFGELRLDLAADDSLEVSDNGGEGVRANGGSDEVVRGVETSDPFSHSLVDSVLQRLRSRSNWDDLTVSITCKSISGDVDSPFHPASEFGTRSTPVFEHPQLPCRQHTPCRIWRRQ